MKNIRIILQEIDEELRIKFQSTRGLTSIQESWIINAVKTVSDAINLDTCLNPFQERFLKENWIIFFKDGKSTDVLIVATWINSCQ